MTDLSLTEFADRLNEIMPVIMREFGKRQVSELYKGKITLPQIFILEFLHREGESKMTSLARFMNVTTAAMTGFINRLVRDAYVARDYEPKDRRVIKVKLTARGNELVKKLNNYRRKIVIDIFSRMSEIDRRSYLRILTQIKDILIKEDTTIA
jgi:DNA-binding MarR family transcriptional regulator